jgi:hypothetical protein
VNRRLAERAAASKLKKQMKRERSPDRDSSSAASASSSSSSASGTNVRFGEVVQAPPKISAVPQHKQRLNITDLQVRSILTLSLLLICRLRVFQ